MSIEEEVGIIAKQEIESFDFSDLDVSDQISDWVNYNMNDLIDTDDIQNEIVNNISLSDFDDFGDLEYRVSKLEDGATLLETAEDTNPKDEVTEQGYEKLSERVGNLETSGRLRIINLEAAVSALFDYIAEPEREIVHAQSVFNNTLTPSYEREMTNGLQPGGRSAIAERADDRTSNQAEQPAEEEAQAGDAAEPNVSG